MSGKTLIKGGCVLTLGSKSQNFAVADVLIDQGKIAEVGPGLRARDAETVDATDTIVMPGFVDSHRHAWKTLMRNSGGSTTEGRGWSDNEQRYRPDDVYAGTLVGLLGAVEAGVTTVVDWSDIQIEPSYTDAVLQAHEDVGLRTVFVHAVPKWASDQTSDDIALRALVSRVQEKDGQLTTLAFGPDDPAAAARLDEVAGPWGLARELGLRIHTHVGSTPAEQGIVSGLADQGLLAKDVTLVHCSHLNDADLDAIATSGASVSLTPSSEMAVGLGAPPIQRLLDHGIRPGLGVEDETVAPGDMFAPMRATISVQHATMFDRKLAGKGSLPHLLNTREVIRYATSDGAVVAGLGGVIGTLEPGMAADVIVLRTDRPNIYPINDPIGAVVWGMDTSNLDWVFVAGTALMRQGSLQADVAGARRLATEAIERVSPTPTGVTPGGTGR